MDLGAQDQKGYASVFIPEDALSAYVTVYAPRNDGNPATKDDVMKALRDFNIVADVDEAAISIALQQSSWGKPILVARGKAAVDGIDGKLDYLFSSPDDKGRPVEMEDGKVDYRDLNLFSNVVKGQLLVVRTPPVEGVNGITVTGRVLKPKAGRNFLLPRGKNTAWDETQTRLYSTVDGHVSMTEGKVNVNSVLNISGDVDFSTGNIDFVGNVAIRGSIVSGFTVKAGGDIEVNGVIEGATVSAGGNILVKNGITGGHKADIFAGISVFARFIENARVQAGDSVNASEAIIQSQIKANTAIRVEGRKGVIVGGLLQAGDEISARVIGSPLAAHTILEVGINPQLREEQKNLIGEYQEKKKAFDNIIQYLQAYQKAGIPAESLPEKRKLALATLLKDYQVLKEDLDRIKERKQELDNEMNRMQNGRIKVAEVINPGVQINIGRAFLNVNDSIKYAMLTYKDGEVKIDSYK